MIPKDVVKLRSILTQLELLMKNISKKDMNLNYRDYCEVEKISTYLLFYVLKAEKPYRKKNVIVDDSLIFGWDSAENEAEARKSNGQFIAETELKK